MGTILDGFVLASANLTSLELDAALQGASVFGSSTGMFITGNFVQNAGATLEIQLGENSPNSLQVGGTANLAGDLTVELLGGFVPAASEEFLILDAGSLVGQFDNAGVGVRIPTADRAGSFAVEYDYNDDTVFLSDYAVAIPGDLNFDLLVDANDLSWWESHYGNLADGSDFLLWQQHFNGGNVGRTTSSSSAVPEPSSLLLVILATAYARRSWGSSVRR